MRLVLQASVAREADERLQLPRPAWQASQQGGGAPSSIQQLGDCLALRFHSSTSLGRASGGNELGSVNLEMDVDC